MMRVLLIADDKDLKELLSFCLGARLPVKIKECGAVRDAIELLKKSEADFGLLIAPYNGPDSLLVRHLAERKEPLPVIFYYDPLVAIPDPKDIGGLLMLGSVEKTRLAEDSGALIKDFLNRDAPTSIAPGPLLEFCPIRTNLLIRATPMKSDIYIRLSESKYVKLFRVGDDFDQKDLERYYETKGVEYMYLKRGETGEFVDKFRRELDSLLARKDLPKEEAMQAAEMSQEAIQELVHRVGFNSEVQQLARKTVELTLKAIGQHPRLADLIKQVSRSGNYLAQHATLLAHVSCCIAKEMEWGSDATFSKLVLASFMHDIAVTDPKIAAINTLRELESRKAEFPEELVSAYHSHPAKAAEMIRDMQEIPADVDQIVHHHHERPNGSGFPRGLSQNYIAPLSVLFIVAHELAQEILASEAGFSLPRFVEEKKPAYNTGNFRKVMAALEKVKL